MGGFSYLLLPLVVVVAEGSEAVGMVRVWVFDGLYVGISLGLWGSHLVCRFIKITTAGLYALLRSVCCIIKVATAGLLSYQLRITAGFL